MCAAAGRRSTWPFGTAPYFPFAQRFTAVALVGQVLRSYAGSSTGTVAALTTAHECIVRSWAVRHSADTRWFGHIHKGRVGLPLSPDNHAMSCASCHCLQTWQPSLQAVISGGGSLIRLSEALQAAAPPLGTPRRPHATPLQACSSVGCAGHGAASTTPCQARAVHLRLVLRGTDAGGSWGAMAGQAAGQQQQQASGLRAAESLTVALGKPLRRCQGRRAELLKLCS